METQRFHLTDVDVDASDIPSKFAVETSEEAIDLADAVLEGEYISLVNKNDLSQVMIYRRTGYERENIAIYKWDGTSCDTSWFEDDGRKIYTIKNAAQLAGLRIIIESGYNFHGKTVQLTSDIQLNHKYWKPIGADYKVEDVADDEDYFRVHLPNKEAVFSGTFDGNSHVIYGLTINHADVDNGQYFAGLFGSLLEADIRNLTLSDVNIGSNQEYGRFSALFGYARKSKFINICIDGKIEGSSCSSIGGVAIDCSFTQCLNRGSIEGYTNTINDILIIGGLVQFIGLSSDIISQVHANPPAVFKKCLQAGSIKIDAKGASAVACGQLFGSTLYKKAGDPYGIQIDHCVAYDGGIPVVENLDDRLTRTNFYGKVNGGLTPKNCISGIDTKIDLLGGILGRTHIKIAVTVIRVTLSTKIDALVIPGSVNTLCSQEHSNSFITNDVAKLNSDDAISNLRPFYKFVKQSRIS